MRAYLKSGFATAVVGLGVLITGSAAYAAPTHTPIPGCPVAQPTYSLTEHSRAIRHDIAVAKAKALRCDTAAAEMSAHKMAPKTAMAPVKRAAPAWENPQSIHEHSPL